MSRTAWTIILMTLVVLAACQSEGPNPTAGERNTTLMATETPAPSLAPTASSVPTEVPVGQKATEERPTQPPTPTNTPHPSDTETTPTRTPASTAEIGDSGKVGIREQASDLTKDEQECLGAIAGLEAPWTGSIFDIIADDEEAHQVLQCLSDESLVKLTLLSSLEHDMQIGSQSLQCLADTEMPGLTRKLFQPGASKDSMTETAVALMAATSFSGALCLTDDEWKILGMDLEQKRIIVCMTEDGATAETLVEATLNEDLQALADFEEISAQCSQEAGQDGADPLTEKTKATAMAYLGLEPGQEETLQLTSWQEVT